MAAEVLPLIETEKALIEQMTTPSVAVRQAVARMDGDILILGAAGKMGPTLAELLVRAGAEKVIGVSRFSNAGQRDYLESVGVETVRADLLDEGALAFLPDASNVYLLAGYKFGATGNEALTWAMNTWLPARVMQRYAGSRIAYVSSGNVYAYTDVEGRGAAEGDELGPIGEYAQSRLGGERLAEYLAQRLDTPLVTVRLFYAAELRYGIIHDIAWKVYQEEAIDLSMGHVNQIWQGDANSYLARIFSRCTTPATVVNMTGAGVLSVRQLATQLGELLGKEPIFIGAESATALLGDATRCLEEFGPPPIAPEQIVRWMAHWVRIGGETLGKPTKYESRSGKF